ncbi:hypothetical protein SAMN02745244_03017 [Tessaracoccus bendigoensis DSM 12906]|uniref:Uncharacterized protein n=1 Tax=Tessaracoccus bendigoensis DSM 12906 TaxID=1123357 RepID=A0A1M6L8M8_9ACTN|nr:hypothetical protein [Tessaracoccus bendigoensis]SHJ67530.1 hypothetical protein SAMN02745244_03017 [Tessaracoccus bendigoensis DSM 12906]
MVETVKRFLHAFGANDWATVRRIVGDRTAAWADYDGFQIGPCPEAPPPYSHLWAWSSDGESLIRVRVDAESCVVGALSREAWPGEGAAPLESHEVEVIKRPGLPWGEDGQIGDQSGEILGRVESILLHETLTPSPVTFVSVSLRH